MIATEVVHGPDGSPVGRIRATYTLEALEFHPIDPRDTRFREIAGRRFTDPGQLRDLVKESAAQK